MAVRSVIVVSGFAIEMYNCGEWLHGLCFCAFCLCCCGYDLCFYGEFPCALANVASMTVMVCAIYFVDFLCFCGDSVRQCGNCGCFLLFWFGC
mgnify:CR=1 FL=1